MYSRASVLPDLPVYGAVAQQRPFQLRAAGAQRPPGDLGQRGLERRRAHRADLELGQAETVALGELGLEGVVGGGDAVLLELGQAGAAGDVLQVQLALVGAGAAVEQLDDLEGADRLELVGGLDRVEKAGQLLQRAKRTLLGQFAEQLAGVFLVFERMVGGVPPDPAQHSLPLGAGPWQVPCHWSGGGPRRTGLVKLAKLTSPAAVPATGSGSAVACGYEDGLPYNPRLASSAYLHVRPPSVRSRRDPARTDRHPLVRPDVPRRLRGGGAAGAAAHPPAPGPGLDLQGPRRSAVLLRDRGGAGRPPGLRLLLQVHRVLARPAEDLLCLGGRHVLPWRVSRRDRGHAHVRLAAQAALVRGHRFPRPAVPAGTRCRAHRQLHQRRAVGARDRSALGHDLPRRRFAGRAIRRSSTRRFSRGWCCS